MLTTTEIQAELARVTYKPGWSFTAYNGDHEGQHLAITCALPDAYRPGETTTLDVDYLHVWLMHRLGRIESHELREFYRVDGKPVSDPHGEDADRDSATYEPHV